MVTFSNQASNSKRYKPGVFLLILLVLILAPALLNIFIQSKNTTPIPIIGGENATVVWLQFWGCYLSAIGSVFVGCVAICDNKSTRKQDEVFHTISRMESEYSALEDEVRQNGEINSILNANVLLRDIYNNDFRSANEKTNEWTVQLSKSSIWVNRHDISEKIFSDYYYHLSQINKSCFDLAVEIKEIINKCESEGPTDELKQRACELIKNYEQKIDFEKTNDFGFNLLQSKRKDIINYQTAHKC